MSTENREDGLLTEAFVAKAIIGAERLHLPSLDKGYARCGFKGAPPVFPENVRRWPVCKLCKARVS